MRKSIKMINRITLQLQSSLTSLQKVQQYLITKAFLIAMVLFTSCTTPPRIIYEGERNNYGDYHGKGVITYSTGVQWEGEFKDGEPYNGRGTYIFRNGEKFIGEFKDGKLNGHGTYTLLGGYQYVGEFKGKNFNEIKHFLTSNNGTRYDGLIVRGTKESGYGIFFVISRISPDGLNRFGFKYEGEFKNDKFYGHGTITFPDGEKYVGDWKDNEYNGQGTFTFRDGKKYAGEFKDGKLNGLGTQTFSDDAKYIGEFKDDRWNGKGVFFNINDEIQSGTWVNGIFKKNWPIEAVDNFLRNKYPQFKGLNYSTSINTN